jgi:hypothetical protein
MKIKIFCDILKGLQNKFTSKTYQNELLSKFENKINPLFQQDLKLEIINLLKHENKSSNVEPTGELIYLSRLNITKFDVLNEQAKFIENFNLFINCIILKINNLYSDCHTLTFDKKTDYEVFFKEMLQNTTLFKETSILIFIKEFIILLRLNNKALQTDKFNLNSFIIELEERINLSFYKIKKRNYFEEDFELHKAVFENNLRMIRNICANETTHHIYCHINEIDPYGNTPLMLAIKLGHYDAINVLCDHDADIKHESFDGDTSPMEYAVMQKDIKTLKILINATKKQKISQWENHKIEVLKVIKQIPDFSMDLKLNFDSNIFSLFSQMTTGDYYTFSKLGGNVRIDMNISAMSSAFKSLKGRTSILIKENGDSINIFKIDHDKKKV